MTQLISKREQEVLHLIAHENSTKMIAEELYISEHTVISHRKSLLAKLEAKNTAGLVRRGFELNILRVAVCLCLLVSSMGTYAQSNNFQLATSINDSGTAPDSSAILDISSSAQGMLIPRMTKAQRDLISDPATSLLIYQSDDNPGFYFNAGTPETPNWQSLTQLAVDASKLIDDDEDTSIELVEGDDDHILTTIDDALISTVTSDLWLANTPMQSKTSSSELTPSVLLENTQDNFSHLGFKNSGFADNRFFISADPSSTGGIPADMRFYWKNVNSDATINFFRMVSSGSPFIEFKQDAIAEMDLTVAGKLQIGDDGDIIDAGTEVLHVSTDWYPDTDNTYDLGSSSLSWEDLYVDDIIDLVSLEFANGLEINQLGQGVSINGPIGVDKNDMYDLGTSILRWKTIYTTTTNTNALDDIGGGNISVDANWLPATDCNYSLGSNTLRWDVLYAKEVETGKLILTPVPPPPSNVCTEEGEILLVDDINGQNEGSVYLIVCLDGQWRPL